MNKTLLIIATALLLLALTGTALAQEPDPLTVMEAYDLALEAKDVEGALALFADEAVLTTRQGQFVGKEEIRAWLERLVTQNERIEVFGRQATGDKVIWQNKFFRADLPALKDAPLEANAEATIEAGKIKTFSSVLTDDSQARLDAASATPAAASPAEATAAPAQEPAPAAQLPATGGTRADDLARVYILVLLGIGLVVAGAAWWRRLEIGDY
ncbi:MAG: nuclear transport factor 2 family protein [Anaerolineae bacterium]|nr:nuclear transport factor 2 family protein [Anaerolineae bacterium]